MICASGGRCQSVAAGLRLWARFREPHQCSCGAEVGAEGRAAPLADTVLTELLDSTLWTTSTCGKRLTAPINVPAAKEPVGLLRSDGIQRPDGLTEIPWLADKCVNWNVTDSQSPAPSPCRICVPRHQPLEPPKRRCSRPEGAGMPIVGLHRRFHFAVFLTAWTYQVIRLSMPWCFLSNVVFQLELATCE